MRTSPTLILLILLASPPQAASQEPAQADARFTDLCDLNNVYTFTPYRTRQEWASRAEHLRRQILFSAGLLPMPVKHPLKARIFDRLERDGYTIEKAYFESHPGFLVTGNLYRPLGKSGPFPAILSPHGHWTYGRLENTETCSVPGRAINFARQGYVVFAYDMIGYNDSTQLTHSFGGRREELWGISLAGLQLWNSIRAVDFLCSLPDVDKERIGATGASGGGTQTFLLMAVDERIKVGAPVNMVSAHMQGGCLCENAPGLRIDTFNVELAALAAPRPLLLVSATGDWTRDTLKVEYPAIQSIYRLFDAQDKVHAVQMNAGHNYNKESREAVYAWFGRWLLGRSDVSQLKEKSFRVEMPPNLLVFYGIERPGDLIDPSQLTSYLIDASEKQLESLRDNSEEFRRTMRPALAHSLAAYSPAPTEVDVRPGGESVGKAPVEQLFLGRKGKGDRVPATQWVPSRSKRVATLVVHEEGRTAVSPDLVAELSKQGHLVLSIDCFQTGSAKGPQRTDIRYFTTYNRTDLANRVQDILTALAYLKGLSGVTRVNLIGVGRAGGWCLLARGLADRIDRTCVDAAQFDITSDQAFLDHLFAPGLRRAGAVRTAALLAAPSPLLIHNTGGRSFTGEWFNQPSIQVQSQQLDSTALAKWIGQSR